MIHRSDFTIDTVLPAIQSGVAVGAGLAAGALGAFSVSNYLVAKVALVASALSAIANNILKDNHWAFRQGAIPVFTAATLAVHAILNNVNVLKAFPVKEWALISVALMVVKAIHDNKDYLLSFVRKAEVKALNAVEAGAETVANAAENAKNNITTETK